MTNHDHNHDPEEPVPCPACGGEAYALDEACSAFRCRACGTTFANSENSILATPPGWQEF